jgi:hypothetical protein
MMENRMAIAVASDNTTQQWISLLKEHSARTWRSADFFICFLWENQSNLDSLSSGIDIPQVEAKVQQISTREISKTW